MDIAHSPAPPRRLLLPDAPALVAGARKAVWLTSDGEVETIDLGEARLRLQRDILLVCHAKALGRRLNADRFTALDLLELFAFVHPARFVVPTPRGLAEALELPKPDGAEDDALTLIRATRQLLMDLTDPDFEEKSDPVAIAWFMGGGGGGNQGYCWPWASFVLSALGAPNGPPGRRALGAFQVWKAMPEWEEESPEPPPGQLPVHANDARRRLADLLQASVRGKAAEPRPQQSDYASAVSTAFTPRSNPGTPNLVLAEAGTGVGKTLGYLAPASLWAEKNRGTVWISTYTRNLQHQIDGELDRLHTDPLVKSRKVVLRKGRENYLCLLNLEEAVSSLPSQPAYATALGLMVRWVAATRDGDMQGGDFPGWLPDLVGRARTMTLADRRGECIYSACQHYRKCFIENTIRRARKADIVIANHALVMIQAALGGEDAALPTRYVFDEGHHVFDAADSAFAGHLTAQETSELRRWLLGAEGGRSSRARGLKRRVEDLVAGDEEGMTLVEAVVHAARALPGEGWGNRLTDEMGTGAAEAFLLMVRRQVHARAHGRDSFYSLETETIEPVDGLAAAAQELEKALARLQTPLEELAKRLAARLDNEAAELDSDTRRRIEAVCRSLQRRGSVTLKGWRDMLK